MLVLGILLLVLAAALFIGFLASGTQEVTFDGGVLDVTMSTLTIYLLGALTLLLLVGGLALIRLGVRQANRRRRERKELSRLSAQAEQRDAASRGEPGEEARTDSPADTSAETTSTTEAQTSTGTTGGAAPGVAPGTSTSSTAGDSGEHGTTRA